MADTTDLLAVFPDLEPAADGIEKLHALGISDDFINVVTGVPVTEPMLGRPHQHSNVPYFTKGGAALGFCVGIFLMFGTPYLYPYPVQVSSQAPTPVPPMFIVIFEMTNLFMLLSTFLGVFLDSYFPNFRPMNYVPEISDGKIAVFFRCPADGKDKFTKAMTALGAEKVTVSEAQQL